MKSLSMFAAAAASLLLIGCKGEPVEYSHACDQTYDKELVEIPGYFHNTGSAMCSRSGKSPMRCPIEFVESPSSTKGIRAYITKGNGSSETNAVEGEGLKIRDNKGKFIDNTTKIKLTAKVHRLTSIGADRCYVDVWRIEREQQQ